MKKCWQVSTLVVALIALITVNGCKKSEPQASAPDAPKTNPVKKSEPQASAPDAPKTNPVSSLEQEAINAVQQRFNEHWTKTGNVWTSKYGQYESFWQLSDVSYTIEESTTTEASKLNNKLNGVEWEGDVHYVAKAHRQWTKAYSGWSPWMNPDGDDRRYTATKRNGQWVVLLHPTAGVDTDTEKVDPAEIPK